MIEVDQDGQDLYRIKDFAFRLRTNNSDARRCIARLYEQFVSPPACETFVEAVLENNRSGRFRWRLGEEAGAASGLPDALWGLEAAICKAIVCSQRRCLAIHAAAVYAGTLAMLVGPSGAGKSTLSLALASRGCAIGTDDVTLVEPDSMHVLPIPRCFHIDTQSARLLSRDGFRFPPTWDRFGFMVPGDLSLQSPARQRVHLLLFMLRVRSERLQVIPISQAQMAAHLLSETDLRPWADPAKIAVLSRLAGGASCYALFPAQLAQTADAVAELLSCAR
jgi:hypothetical protein